MNSFLKPTIIDSKKRVLKTFAHEKTDRVPIDYYGNPDITSRLKRYFGLDEKDQEGLRKALGVDFRGLSPVYTGERLHMQLPDLNVNSQWGIRTRWIEHAKGGYYDVCNFPLQDADEEMVSNWPMPSPDDYDYKALSEQCEQFKEYAVFAGDAGIPDVINGTSRLRGMEQVLIDLVTDNPAGLMLIDRRLDILFEILCRILEICKGKIDFMWIGEDLGTQHAPLISMKLFRDHIKPRLQRFIDLAKAYNLPVMIHCCGSSSWAFSDFIEMGINAVDTLQPEAKDMNPKYIKESFGKKLAFHGCISTGGSLAFGSVRDVIGNVRQTLEIMMSDGGYCFAPTHAIQDNTPTENVIAMYKAVQEYGFFN